MTSPTPSATADRLDAVLARLDRACERAGRDRGSVHLLLATKTRSADEVHAALQALADRGLPLLAGENRPQELAKFADPRLAALRASGALRVHMIGRLQKNKAKTVVEQADCVESVDQPELIAALAHRVDLARLDRPLPVLIQVNTSGEETKGGYAPEPEAVAAAVVAARETGRLAPVGLMTIGRHVEDVEDARPSLRRLRELRDEVRPRVGSAAGDLTELSMGMTADAEVAVEEGATIVRIGTAVFGPR